MLSTLLYPVKNKQLRPYFILSLSLHFILIGLMIVNISFVDSKAIKVASSSKANKNNKSKIVEPIKAVAVDNELVQNEIKRLEQVEKDKKQKEQRRQEKIKKELAKIKKQKQQEAKRVAAEKRKAAELKKQQEEIARNAAKLKKELASKKAEKQKIEQELKEKQALKQQEELLEKIKQEQEQKLLESLSDEDEIIANSKQRRSLVQREMERYIALQQAKVSRNWISRDSFLGRNLVTKLEIRLASDGRVINVSIVKASGNDALDISAKNAILKASPLPVPEDSSIRKNFARYRFTFRPDELT